MSIQNQIKKSEKVAIFHVGRGGCFYNGGHKTIKDIANSFSPDYYGINIYPSFEHLDNVIKRSGVDRDDLFYKGWVVDDAAFNWIDNREEYAKEFDELNLKDEAGNPITYKDLGDAIILDDSGDQIATMEEYQSTAGRLEIDGEYNTYIWIHLRDLDQAELEIVFEDSICRHSYWLETGQDKLLEEMMKCQGADVIASYLYYDCLNVEELIKDEILEESNEEDSDFEIDNKYYQFIR